MSTAPHVAIVGAGISGLGAAHALVGRARISLFERDTRLGGHAHTITHLDPDAGPVALDTGFLVHNPVTYPRFVRLLEDLGVAWQPSEMSFSVVCQRCELEYSGRHLWRQPDVVRDRRVRRLLGEIVRFMRTSPRDVDDPRLARTTLEGYVRARGYSGSFRDHFLVPLTAAIWSTAPGQVRGFPIAYALRFYANHGLLGFRRHGWRAIVGGSVRYVDAIAARLGDGVHVGCGIQRVEATHDGVLLTRDDGTEERADAVVLATHPDTSLRLLADPDDDERDLLGRIPYTDSVAILHTDTAMLPRRAACRAAWNYQLVDCHDTAGAPTMTYYLNRLQRLGTPTDYMVTLNRGAAIDPGRVIATIPYAHPRYTFDSLAAQQQISSIDGRRRVWFAGAYRGYGFHEDGLRAGQEAARAVWESL